MLNFRSNEDLGKLTKEYLTDLVCKFGAFCLQHSETWHITRFSTGNHRSNRYSFFDPPCSSHELSSVQTAGICLWPSGSHWYI